MHVYRYNMYALDNVTWYFSFLGETIEPMKIDEVTMLFSDIVGFTAICSSCTPLMVINMLNSLYTQFDYFCGELDVYKVSLSPLMVINMLNSLYT